MLYVYALGVLTGMICSMLIAFGVVLYESIHLRRADLENKNWMCRREYDWEEEAALMTPELPKKWRV